MHYLVYTIPDIKNMVPVGSKGPPGAPKDDMSGLQVGSESNATLLKMSLDSSYSRGEHLNVVALKGAHGMQHCFC